MKSTRFVFIPALATGIAGAFFLSLMSGSASASCGYTLTEHPSRDHFAAASSSAQQSAQSDWEERTKHPLRGDFPYAAVNPPTGAAKEWDWQERTTRPLRGDFPRAAAILPAK